MKRRSSETPSSSKLLEENIAHKNWRSVISELCSDLTSIIPPQYFPPSNKDVLSQADQIEHATNYIVQLKERVDNLNKIKEQLKVRMLNQEAGTSSSNQQNTASNDATIMAANSSLPIIEVKDLDNSLEVQLVLIEQEHSIKLHEVIRVLEEEGAEVVNATCSNTGNKILHTLHAKARSSRVGVEASRVRTRLHELI